MQQRYNIYTSVVYTDLVITNRILNCVNSYPMRITNCRKIVRLVVHEL